MRVVLADDHEPLREALKALLESEPGVEVVGEASDGSECIDVVDEHRPDLLLVDIRMPGIDGIQATREVTRRFPGVRVVALSSYARGSQIADMFAAGARGYLVKTAPSHEVRAAVRDIRQGRPAVSPQAFEGVLQDLTALYRAGEQRADRLAVCDRMRRELLTMVSDSLRNPLTAIQGASSTLRRGREHLDAQTVHELVVQIDQQAARMVDRVDDVISAVSDDRGDGLMDLADVVSKAAERMRGRPGHARIRQETEPLEACGDQTAAVTVVMCLVNRWLAATDSDIRVRTRVEDDGRPAVEVVWETSALRHEADDDASAAVLWAALERLLVRGGGALRVEGRPGELRYVAVFRSP
jgi:DNA-binding NarL/FixJ family response regulator